MRRQWPTTLRLVICGVLKLGPKSHRGTERDFDFTLFCELLPLAHLLQFCPAHLFAFTRRSRCGFPSSFFLGNAEILMSTKHILLNAATVCMVALAVLMTQAVFHQTATATPRAEDDGFVSLTQRVVDLEDRQDANDNEFVLIDGSLGDLDARVNANDASIRANSTDIRALQTKVKEMDGRLSIQRAEHRTLVSQVAKLRARCGSK